MVLIRTLLMVPSHLAWAIAGGIHLHYVGTHFGWVDRPGLGWGWDLAAGLMCLAFSVLTLIWRLKEQEQQ